MSIKQSIRRWQHQLDKHSMRPSTYPFMMTEAEKAVFDKAIREAREYLEFGMGGSTLRALSISDATIHAVESSPEWIETMREWRLLRRSETGRLHIHPVDIGPTGKWGAPISKAHKNRFENYTQDVFSRIDPNRIDLVLVDGRFRVACALNALRMCHGNDQLRIIIHDFWDREFYHVVLNHLEVVQRVDNLGLFRAKADVDLTEVERDYEAYKTNDR